MKTISRSLCLLAIAFSLFTACQKEVAGPKGDTGATGPAGPKGDAGKDASVVSSGNIVVLPGQWLGIPPDSVRWQASLGLAMITSQVVQNGSVDVFILKENRWQPLPFFDHTSFLTFAYETGKLYLIAEDSHGGSPPKPEQETFRVTAITAAGIKKNGPTLQKAQIEEKSITD